MIWNMLLMYVTLDKSQVAIGWLKVGLLLTTPVTLDRSQLANGWLKATARQRQQPSARQNNA